MDIKELTTDVASRVVSQALSAFNTHGECRVNYGNGEVWEHCFMNHGELHGIYMHYNQYGTLQQKYLFYHGKRIKRKYSAWLPEKPTRKEYKSNRNRFQTLEV